MYKFFDAFSVSGEREPRDPQCLLRLSRERNTGTRMASVVLFIVGLARIGPTAPEK